MMLLAGNASQLPIHRKNTTGSLLPIPAAQYLRMSDEMQLYSVDNQKAAILEYAQAQGFVIVKTYCDFGKSGVVAKNRAALRELLNDVATGTAEYKAVLVYDISR
jgi:DNA invertase Pin-like site-specific DNA recombinase